MLARLEALPRLVVPVVTLVLLLVGLMAAPVFAVPALALLVAFVAWLASLSWTQADAGGRALRVVVVLALGVALVVRLAQALA